MKWMRLLSQNQGARGTSNAKPAALYWLLAQRYAENKKTTQCVVLCIWLPRPSTGRSRAFDWRRAGLDETPISPNWALLAQRYAENKKTTQCVVLCIWLRLLGSNQRPND